MRRSVRNILLLPAVLALPQIANAHPQHFSHAEIEYNADSGSLEVALRLSATDLARALQRIGDRPVDFDSSGSAEYAGRLMRRYLKKSFVVSMKEQPKPLPIQWVGYESTVQHVWLYFEVACKQGLDGVSIRNELLIELEPAQRNIVHLKNGTIRQTLVFDHERRRQTLKSGSEE